MIIKNHNKSFKNLLAINFNHPFLYITNKSFICQNL